MMLNQEEAKKDFGYYFYPTDRPGNPGHPRLDIILRSTPSGRHFDPETARFRVTSRLLIIETLVVSHPWQGLTDNKVIAGRVILRDRFGKTAEAFTFGGDLHIETEIDQTVCTLRSPAPILGLIYDQNVAAMLAQEVEVLFAERRAAWAHDLEAYERRLAAIDPFTLYVACLQELRERFRHFPSTEDPLVHKLVQCLHDESQDIYRIHSLPAETKRLSDLL